MIGVVTVILLYITFSLTGGSMDGNFLLLGHHSDPDRNNATAITWNAVQFEETSVILTRMTL